MRSLLLSGLLLLPTLACLAKPSQPMLGSPSTLSLPRETADYIGQRLLATLRAQHALLPDPVSQQYIQVFGNHLAAASPTPHPPFHFFILNHDSINAFATPGGRIAVFSGLIESAQSASELAGVLAHESAHLSQHHMSRMLANQHQNMIPAAVAMIAAIAAASKGHGDVASGILVAGQATSLTQQMRQNRGYEQEADRIGMQTLHRGHFNPYGMPTFLKRMRQQTLAYQQRGSGLASHPLLNQRIADTSDRAMQYPKKSVSPSLLFQLIRIRVSVITSLSDPTPSAWQLPKGLPTTMQSTLKQYHEAFLDLHQQQWDQAKAILLTLHQQQPSNPVFTYDLADINHLQHHDRDAIQLLQQSVKQPALHVASLWLLSQCYAQNHQTAKAIHTLQLAIHSAPPEPSWYRQLAMLQAQEKQWANAYLSQAKALAINLRLHAAIIQLNEALKRSDLSAKDKQQLAHARQQYRYQRQTIHRILRS